MQLTTSRERPLTYRRLINGLLMLGMFGAVARFAYEVLQPDVTGWGLFNIIPIAILWIVVLFVMRRASVTFGDRGPDLRHRRHEPVLAMVRAVDARDPQPRRNGGPLYPVSPEPVGLDGPAGMAGLAKSTRNPHSPG